VKQPSKLRGVREQRVDEKRVVNRSIGQPPRFRSRYDLRSLVDVVAAVARVAAPEAPGQISQRAYDAARAAAGYANAPTAKQIAARLGMSWKAVLALALDPTRSVDSVLGAREGEEDKPWLTSKDVCAALKIVARRLGKKTLKPVEYRLERKRMLDAARHSYRHLSELSLPTEGQIERTAGSWDEALVIAGLAPRPRATAGMGVPIVAVLELFLETFGYLPGVAQLEGFARAQGIPLAKRRRPYADYIAELAKERAEWGKWTPEKPPHGMKPCLTTPAPGVAALLSDATGGKRKKRWTREECVEALAQLLAEWPNDKRLTEDAYQEVSRGRDDLPSLSSLQRGARGGFRELVRRARS
jgi:hypothetical protein